MRVAITIKMGKFSHQFIERSVSLISIIIERFENRTDIVLDGQAAKNTGFLWQISHAKPRALKNGQGCYILPVDIYAARIRRNQAR